MVFSRGHISGQLPLIHKYVLFFFFFLKGKGHQRRKRQARWPCSRSTSTQPSARAAATHTVPVIPFSLNLKRSTSWQSFYFHPSASSDLGHVLKFLLLSSNKCCWSTSVVHSDPRSGLGDASRVHGTSAGQRPRCAALQAQVHAYSGTHACRPGGPAIVPHSCRPSWSHSSRH